MADFVETDLVFQLSDNVPVDETSTAGGGNSGVTVAKNSTGTLLPNISNLAVGNVDSGATQTAYSLGYGANANSSYSCDLFAVWGDNLISDITAPGLATLSMSDTGGYTQIWGTLSGSSIVTSELLTWTGGTISGSKTWSRIELIVHVNAFGTRIVTTAGVAVSVNGQPITSIPPGYSYATREISILAAGVKGDLGTFANRRTDPTGGGTFLRPNTNGTAMPLVSLTTTFNAGESCGIYFRVQRQPVTPQVYGPTGCLISWNLQARG